MIYRNHMWKIKWKKYNAPKEEYFLQVFDSILYLMKNWQSTTAINYKSLLSNDDRLILQII